MYAAVRVAPRVRFVVTEGQNETRQRKRNIREDVKNLKLEGQRGGKNFINYYFFLKV